MKYHQFVVLFNIGEFSLTGFTRLTRLFYLFGH